MRWLDVGSGPQSFIKSQYPGEDVVSLDGNADNQPDVVFDLTGEEFQAWEPEPFDRIWMSHVLEHLNPVDAAPVLKKLASLLTEGGQLHVKVPSLEWACEQIMWETGNPAVLYHLYGSKQDRFQNHLWGYTLPELRRVMRQYAGLQDGAAVRGWYQIGIGGKRYDAEEHYIVGIKPGGEHGNGERS